MLGTLGLGGQQPVGPRQPPVRLGTVAAQPQVDGEHEGRQRPATRRALLDVQSVGLAIVGDHLVAEAEPVGGLGPGVEVVGAQVVARVEGVVRRLPVPSLDRLVCLRPRLHARIVARATPTSGAEGRQPVGGCGENDR